jgi:hypothetical protein
MADLTLAPPKQQMKGSGVAALFGLFTGFARFLPAASP